MYRVLYILIIIFFNPILCQAGMKKFEVTSPDKNIGVSIEVGNRI